MTLKPEDVSRLALLAYVHRVAPDRSSALGDKLDQEGTDDFVRKVARAILTNVEDAEPDVRQVAVHITGWARGEPESPGHLPTV